MKSKLLFGVVAAIASFALVAGVSIADDTCTHLSVNCSEWDETNPLVEGTCCTKFTGSYEACGTGTKAAKPSSVWTSCGHKYPIVSGSCGETSNGKCGGQAAEGAGCTTATCAG